MSSYKTILGLLSTSWRAPGTYWSAQVVSTLDSSFFFYQFYFSPEAEEASFCNRSVIVRALWRGRMDTYGKRIYFLYWLTKYGQRNTTRTVSCWRGQEWDSFLVHELGYLSSPSMVLIVWKTAGELLVFSTQWTPKETGSNIHQLISSSKWRPRRQRSKAVLLPALSIEAISEGATHIWVSLLTRKSRQSPTDIPRGQLDNNSLSFTLFLANSQPYGWQWKLTITSP